MTAGRPSTMEPIAVVGTSAIMPGAPDVDDFWRNILEGRDLMTDIPADRWLIEDYYDPDPKVQDRTYAKRGAFLPEVGFDPMHFGLPPRAVPATDTAQLLALVAADRLMTGLGGVPGEQVGVYLGSAALQAVGEMAMRMARPLWWRALREEGVPAERAQAVCDRLSAHQAPWQEATFPGLLSNVVAGRIAHKYDLHGANFTVDAACASSLAALSVAVDDLLLGRSDLVITGGVDTLNDAMTFTCFSKTPALSPTGGCRPFAEAADGTLLGEGLALFALKRLADAERDGDPVHAVIRGVGSSSDGSGTSIYAPLETGQARAMRRAYGAAGYSPGTVGLVEAHGTGTIAGDAAEVAALRTVFEESGREDRQWCALGSVKSQIGHTKAAAGAAGLLKAVLALQHRVLPPTINVDRPHPSLALDTSPFHLNRSAKPWVHTGEHPRRASVSSFGFGGANFHVTLEEYAPAGKPSAPRQVARPTEMVPLSAVSPEELSARCGRIADLVRAGGTLASIARSAQQEFRSSHPYRLAVVAEGTADLTAKLPLAETLIGRHDTGTTATPTGVHHGAGPCETGRIAFVFPGQGSQHPGMGGDLALHSPQAQAVWQWAAEQELGGESLTEVVFPVDAFTDEERHLQEERLTRAEWAQPAIAAHSLALLGLLEAVGLRPDCVAGHSFGELTALHAARAFDADTLVRLAHRRGELLRDAAAGSGAMLAVAAPAERIAALLADAGPAEVWVANDNAPGQVVLAGSTDGVESAAQRCSDAGLDVRRLSVATAFHCPLTSGAAGPLAEYLAELTIRAPRLDVYGNADAAVYPVEPVAVRTVVARHLASPVRFQDMVKAMYRDGVRTFVEVGPGSALTALVGQILDGLPHHAVATDRAGRHGVTQFHDTLARLAVLGVPLSWTGLWEQHRAVPPARSASAQTRMLIPVNGRNHGRIHPAPRSEAEPAATEAEDIAPAPPTPSTRSTVPLPVPGRRRDDGSAQRRAGVGDGAGSGPDNDAADRPDNSAGRRPAAQPPVSGEEAARTVRALLELQRQTSEAHTAYLRLAEKSLEALSGAVGPHDGDPVAYGTVALVPDTPWEPLAWDAEPAISVRPPLPAPAAPHHQPAAGAPAGSPVRSPRSLSDPADLADLEATVLAVVSEKTGYPLELLAPHLELEADLGLDSITKVQILAALRGVFPELETVDRSRLARLAGLNTVGDVAAHLRELFADGSSPAADEPTTGPVEARVHRYSPVMVSAPPSGRPIAGLGTGTLVVTEEPSGLAQLVVDLLGERGVRAEVRAEVPADADGVLFLGGMAGAASADAALTVQREAFRAARAVAHHMTRNGGVFVTVQDTGGDFGLRTPDPCRSWLGGLAGLARTAAAEWPRASVKAIDCARGNRTTAEVALALVDELLTGASTSDVGLAADGTRWTQEFTETEPHDPQAVTPLDLGEKPVILVTGGARGITAAALAQFARSCPARFVLIGRSAPDGPHASELRATTAALERTGSLARYVGVDIRDRDRLREVLSTVRTEWGPVTGLVHGAGVLADRLIADKTTEQFDEVFGTKAEGLAALLAETREDPLRLLCVFSSVVGVFGNAGQCDYAMANETLNHVLAAQRAERPDAVLRALIWGPWQGGMVTPELGEVFRMGGVPLLTMAAGARAFTAELGSSGVQQPRVLLSAGPAAAFTGRTTGDNPAS